MPSILQLWQFTPAPGACPYAHRVIRSAAHNFPKAMGMSAAQSALQIPRSEAIHAGDAGLKAQNGSSSRRPFYIVLRAQPASCIKAPTWVYRQAPCMHEWWKYASACIALVEKKIPYNLLLAKKAEKPNEFEELYQAIWPDPKASAKVPIIIDTDGTQLTESLVVVEYIESKYKKSGTQLIPDNPALAAKARLFGEFFAGSFTSTVFFKNLQATTKAEASDAEAALLHGIGGVDAFLRTHGTGAPFLLGSQYSFAEVATASFLWRSKVTLSAYRNFDLLDRAQSAGHQRFVGWAQAVLERPSTKETILSEEECVAAFKPFVKEILA